MQTTANYSSDNFDKDPGFYKALMNSLETNSVLRVMDENGDYIPVNCSGLFADMMECEPQEFLDAERKQPLCTVHPDDLEKAKELLRTGHSPDHVIRKLTLRGNTIWVHIQCSFFSYGGKKYAYFVFFDVTSIKKNEFMTQQRYDDLDRELRMISSDNLCALRSNLTKRRVEKISGTDLYDCDKVGASMETLLKRRLECIPNPADRELFYKYYSIEAIMKCLETGEDMKPIVIFFERQSGKRCFVRCSAGIRRDPVTGDATVFAFETEYNAKRVRDLLDQKILAQQFEMISYILGDSYGVVIGDPKHDAPGSIFPINMNGLYADYINEQVIPAVNRRRHDPEKIRKALLAETIKEQLKTNESYSVYVSCRFGDDIYYKCFTFYEVDRGTEFYILLEADYTEMQHEQTERNRYLKNALEEAKQANIAKTAFLSNMSHEIRTPMNAIIGLNNIALNEENLPQKTRGHLEQIGSSARHLLGLINDILDMSRIESGRMIIRNEEFSFGNMIEQINTMVSGQCLDKGLTYDCIINGHVDDYYIGDDTKLKQVLINILGNAVKFTPGGGSVTMEVERTAIFENKSTLRFIIRDTGIGIDKDYLPQLFDAFTQENIANTSQYGGSGLGMAITKNIVELMNGNILVKSEKGSGSEFTVNVTLGNSARSGKYVSDIRPQDMDVLVIDDDPIACDHAKLALGEAGIRSESALSGKDALELIRIRLARHEPYNLILVDLYMPEQNGLEVTRDIRALVGSETTVIILTAYNWEDVAHDALEAGVDSFLSKPLFSSNALELFSKAIRQKRERKEKQQKMTALEGKRVLLAEDVEINAKIMKHLLEMKKINVEVAENGKEALDKFLNAPEGYFDAVLMDVRMPVMDGLDAASAIRASSRSDSADIPIIAMTANAFDEDVQRSLQAGMNAHLSKPVEPDLLFDTLRSYISGK